MNTSHVRHQGEDRQVGVIRCAVEVDDIWGTVLLIPPGPTAGDDFEARVQRVWEHMKGGYFTFEEHDRLREELGRLIAKEGTSEYQ